MSNIKHFHLILYTALIYLLNTIAILINNICFLYYECDIYLHLIIKYYKLLSLSCDVILPFFLLKDIRICFLSLFENGKIYVRKFSY
uniref:7TM_GPCR_Srx domain-containing protein n=1 Tax=Strongyloides papillosus TaxID=174720 RepID=A0A0N5CFG6_STREA